MCEEARDVKVFLSCDMEGVAGVVDWSQCRPDGGPAYAVGSRLMGEEVNAAIRGAVAGGATEVVVNDSHGAMFNLDPATLEPPVTYLSGRHKPGYMMEGLDSSYDAVFFLGYHGSISGPSSVLSHTYNPEVISAVRLDGELVGESGINALVAAAYDVPVALITGDAVTLEEMRAIAPDSVGVATKTSVSRFAAHSLHPRQARDAIEAGARRAVEAVDAGRVGAVRVSPRPALEVDLHTADMAEVASWVKGVQRSAIRTVTVSGGDGAAVFRAFVALTYITRQAGGR